MRHSVCRGADDVGPCGARTDEDPIQYADSVLPAGLIQAIRDHIDRCCFDKLEVVLFPAFKSSGGIISTNTLGQQFHKARARAGRRDITFHSLRATHTTTLMIEGSTLQEARTGLATCPRR
ncbi:hypothetical protein [Bifidobacterium coryneforme]|uniref:hypothetical protein n=1 Tax=Bifidobacterium coryneforme TaxID=1687 RepID=UPI0023F04157|nr:hypothetical protein [Bifidobacterium coryneforme]